MDFFEKLFGLGARSWSARRREARRRTEARAEDCFETLVLLARAAAGDAELEILLTEEETARLEGTTLFLPRIVRRFAGFPANQHALLRLALVGGATHAPGRGPGDVETFLEAELAGYARWRDHHAPALAEPGSFFTVPRGASPPSAERQYDPSGKRGEPAKGTERSAGSAEARETVDLDKERSRNNPVTHSFEKMETADEYQGGHRIQDGTDQLDEHAAALDELRLRHVTRSHETTASVYRAEGEAPGFSRESPLAAPAKPGFLLYPEWDYARRALRPDHCRLFAESSPSADPSLAWKRSLEEKHAAKIALWQGRFSGIRNQRRWRGGQWDGEELEIDRYVRYRGDLRRGSRGDPRVFASRRPALRDLATLILLDQSYSTDAYVEGLRVLDVERDAVGLAGLLLDDQAARVAVAGTWSETRSNCHFLWHKGYDEPWARLYERAADLRAGGYTRLGPAIRHASRQLCDQPAKGRLLVLLTDGKPTDYDRYEGRYGIEDIRHAILEAEQRGVVVKALAVESEARRYFPSLFGARNYRILSQPEQLPEELFRLFLEACKIG